MGLHPKLSKCHRQNSNMIPRRSRFIEQIKTPIVALGFVIALLPFVAILLVVLYILVAGIIGIIVPEEFGPGLLASFVLMASCISFSTIVICLMNSRVIQIILGTITVIGSISFYILVMLIFASFCAMMIPNQL